MVENSMKKDMHGLDSINGPLFKGDIQALRLGIEGANVLFRSLENGLFKIITDAISLSRSKIPPKTKKIEMLTNEKDLINSYFLRSYVYNLAGYDSEFRESVEGLEFDKFDSSSISFGYIHDGEMVGSIRIALDGTLGFPSEKYCPEIANLREDSSIAEISRTVILPEFRNNLGILFEQIIASIQFARLNGIDKVFYGSPKPIMEMYEKHVGGSIRLRDNVQYGNLKERLYFRAVDVNNLSPKFEKKMERRLLQ